MGYKKRCKMQLNLNQDTQKEAEKEKEQIKKRAEEEIKWQEEKALAEKEFNEKYKQGCCCVMLKDGQYYFWGDMQHCGTENILHNARAIKQEMIKRNAKYGHMNCNDLPTFEKGFDWDKELKQLKECYKEDLYVFKGDAVEIFMAIRTEKVCECGKSIWKEGQEKCDECDTHGLTNKDYIYCEDCQEYVDFWQYSNRIEDTGHKEHKWRFVTDEEFRNCIKDCVDDGCFDE